MRSMEGKKSIILQPPTRNYATHDSYKDSSVRESTYKCFRTWQQDAGVQLRVRH